MPIDNRKDRKPYIKYFVVLVNHGIIICKNGIYMKIAIVTHQSGEQLPLLLDQSGMPIPLPNEFILSRRFQSTATLTRNLRELSVLYRWLDEHGIDLIAHFSSLRSFTEAELKGSLIESLRSKSSESTSTSVRPNTFNQRLTTIRQYLSWVIDICSNQLSVASLEYESLREIKADVLKVLDNSFMSPSPTNKGLSKGITDEETDFLLKVLDPASIKSGMGRSSAIRGRNFVIVAIMLYCGLRPGELLSLRVEDITIGAISSIAVVRRSPDPHDTRHPRPSIKRNGRIIPIENRRFVDYLNQYITTWRDELEESSTQESDYLILSDEGTPLSLPSVTQFFQILRKKFPDSLPQNLTAKSLRHRFSSQLERALRKAGLDEHRRREALAHMRGDSSLNSQDTYIAQEIEEQASAALMDYQRRIFK